MDLTVTQRVKLLESQIKEAISLIEYGSLYEQVRHAPRVLRDALVQVEVLGSLALNRGCCQDRCAEEEKAWHERETDTSWNAADNPYTKAVAECWDEIE